jgi:hypothetical protein
MVASLKRVYENLWTIQKDAKKVPRAQNRALVTHLRNQASFDQNQSFLCGRSKLALNFLHWVTTSVEKDLSALRMREKGDSKNAVLHPEIFSIT